MSFLVASLFVCFGWVGFLFFFFLSFIHKCEFLGLVVSKVIINNRAGKNNWDINKCEEKETLKEVYVCRYVLVQVPSILNVSTHEKGGEEKQTTEKGK